jgi:hypothetical protein
VRRLVADLEDRGAELFRVCAGDAAHVRRVCSEEDEAAPRLVVGFRPAMLESVRAVVSIRPDIVA